MTFRYRLLILAAALLLGLSGRRVSAGLSTKGTRLLCNGKPVFLRGSYYVQPAAYHHCFLIEFDERQMARDFRRMRKLGMNCLAISVNWGDFISRLDVAKRRCEWNAEVGRRLRRLLDCARRENLIVDLWFGTARAPVGLPGCRVGESEKDLCGHLHRAFCGYMWQNYPGCAQFDDFEWQAFLDYHRRVAELTRGFDNVIFDPLDWQHLNMNYWAWGNERNLEAWRTWLRRRNPDLSYWNKRWGENGGSWSQVFFPVDDWVRQTAARLGGSPYAGKPDTPEGPKWKGFRAWHDGLCNEVATAITGVLKEVRPDVLIGQRVDIWHYGDFRANTWAAGQVDFIFQGWYSEKPEQARSPGRFIAGAVRDVAVRWPRPVPMVFWETGMNMPDLPERQADELQAVQFAVTERTAQELHLSGWMWWTWRDYCMSKAALRFGLTRVDGTPKPALQSLPRIIRGHQGRPKTRAARSRATSSAGKAAHRQASGQQ